MASRLFHSLKKSLKMPRKRQGRKNPKIEQKKRTDLQENIRSSFYNENLEKNLISQKESENNSDDLFRCSCGTIIEELFSYKQLPNEVYEHIFSFIGVAPKCGNCKLIDLLRTIVTPKEIPFEIDENPIKVIEFLEEHQYISILDCSQLEIGPYVVPSKVRTVSYERILVLNCLTKYITNDKNQIYVFGINTDCEAFEIIDKIGLVCNPKINPDPEIDSNISQFLSDEEEPFELPECELYELGYSDSDSNTFGYVWDNN